MAGKNVNESFKMLLVALTAKNVDIYVGESDAGKDEKIRAVLHKETEPGVFEHLKLGHSTRIDPKTDEKMPIEGTNLKPGKKLTGDEGPDLLNA